MSNRLSPMPISGFDHVAIPVRDIARTVEFYRRLGFIALGCEPSTSTQTSFAAIQFGEQKINLHGPALWQDPASTLRGRTALPGCGDFCFVWEGTADDLRQALDRAGAPVEVGPVERTGGRRGGTALGTSMYIRDPDDNLLEFIVYPTE
jgi:catechol 2,3-dioxygenase-like lactoylglutathione lyase family enzyme